MRMRRKGIKGSRPKCDNCEKPADYNFQELWTTWVINYDEEPYGKNDDWWYDRLSEINTGDNIFYCQRCAEKEGYI